jgi:hypothetical protein
MKKKKQFTFTLNQELMDWFKTYASDEDRSMSSILNSYILTLKRGNHSLPKPTNNVLKVK